MFKSYTFLEYLRDGLHIHVDRAFLDQTSQPRYQYKIVDDDFVYIGSGNLSYPWREMTEAIIDTYSVRGLPVAKNLLRAFVYETRTYTYTINEFIRWYKTQPSYEAYGKELEKYLILL